MNPGEAVQVSDCVGKVISELPEALQEMIEEVPIVLLDEPSPQMLRDLGIDSADAVARFEISGLHTGIPFTEETVEAPPELPTVIHLFRIGLAELARDEAGRLDPETLEREVRITVLHELGHQFGLDEDDLESLGYG